MKRNSRVVVSVSLIVAGLIIVLGLVGLSAVFAAPGGDVSLISPRINVAATAQAIRFENRRSELESASQERLALLQTEIEQLQSSLIQHNQVVQTQTTGQNNRLATVQAQTVEKQATVEALQLTMSQLQQEMVSQKDSHQIALNIMIEEMQQAESGLLAELQAVTNQLQTAQARLDALATPTPELLASPVEAPPPLPAQDDSSADNSDNSHSEESGESEQNGDDSEDESDDEDEDDDEDERDDDEGDSNDEKDDEDEKDEDDD